MSFLSNVYLRNSMLAKLKDDLALGFIYIYGYATGNPAVSAPADAGAVMTTGLVELVKISVGGDGVTGLTLDTPAAGIITKNTASWWGTIGRSGTAVCYRFCAPGDNGMAVATTQKRVQGIVGLLSPADLLVANTSFTAAGIQNINYYAIGLPTT